ncbi:tetratricopeptide repeat protein [Nocardia takedensis]|uniref:hypothetical protein n=1 Tax=Nocardia takedensis TaxID=259390 RepID=UPI0003061668|nr:hypothetical protein [Nocardia takedensis]
MRTVEAVIARARVAKEVGRAEEAHRMLGAALLTAPDDPVLLEELADVCMALSRPDDALRHAGRSIALEPERAGPHMTVALVYDMLGMGAHAERHARTALRLAPDDAGASLILASTLVAQGRSATRAEARALLERAASDANVDGRAAIARLYLALGEQSPARAQVEAGLREDPVHPELLTMRAKLEPQRGAAVAILRGLLGMRPGHLGARRQLAAITWRAMMRLAGWLWFFTAIVIAASVWIGPGGLRWVSTLAFVVMPVAWFGVFRTLRRQLPAGYLMRRLLRPSAITALVALVLSCLVAELGVVLLRLDWTVEAVRAGYVLLLSASCGAGLAHLLFFVAWLRGGAEQDADDSRASASVDGIVVLALGLPVLGALFALRRWEHQPAACWVLLALLCGVVFVHLLEVTAAQVADTPRPRRAAMVLLGMVPMACALLGFWWAAAHLDATGFRSAERLAPPPFPEIHLTPLPPLPTITVPPLVTPPPAGER